MTLEKFRFIANIILFSHSVAQHIKLSFFLDIVTYIHRFLVIFTLYEYNLYEYSMERFILQEVGGSPVIFKTVSRKVLIHASKNFATMAIQV